jgi:hypothetical protein
VSDVPTVAVAQWTDQSMNAWYVEAAWRVDVRVRPVAPLSRMTPDTWDENRRQIRRRGKPNVSWSMGISTNINQSINTSEALKYEMNLKKKV